MRHILPGLTLAATAFALTVAHAQSPTAPAPPGQKLVADAAAQLDRQPSIEAKIRQRILLLGHPLVGVGSYAQLGPREERLLRLELKVQLAGQATSVQQICDGRFLWLRRQAPQGATLGRVDLRLIRQAMERSRIEPAADPGTSWILLGGLPELLKSLDESFVFGPGQAGHVGDIPVWTTEGAWRPERLASILPKSADAIRKGNFRFAEAPSHLPERVVVTLDQQQLFPYRVEYLRRSSEIDGGAGQGSADALASILTMELYEARLGGKVDPLHFRCHPGDLPVTDHTEMYLQKLGLKAAETAKAEPKTILK